MKASELRIGNFISTDNEEELIVRGINQDHIYASKLKENPSGYYSNISIKPIPLTKERLLKFGFTFVHVPSAYGYDCNKYCVDKKYILRGAWNGKFFFALEILNNGSHKKIEFVDQLQNLYFALTGEELTYNQ